MGILLPALNAARRQARMVQCSVHLQSIGKACMTQASNNHGYLPLAGRLTAHPMTNPGNYPSGIEDRERRRYQYVPSGSAGSIDVAVVPFTAALAPYLGVNGLPDTTWNDLDQALNAKEGVWRRFMCPDIDSSEKGKYNANPNDSNVTGQGTMMICAIGPSTAMAWATNSDYAANEGVFGYHYDSAYRRTRLAGKLTAIRRDTEVALFGDALPRQTPADPILPMGWLTWTPRLDVIGPVTLGDALAGNGRAESAENFDLKRHGKRMNIVFADGHVEGFPVTKEALDLVYLVAP
jgi:prepilin-type processing-associated H-X9-DG protein